tara:strand:+ start:1021 stop:1176 length:156 start_codon:yes stop_codon:yes gene_type:complete
MVGHNHTGLMKKAVYVRVEQENSHRVRERSEGWSKKFNPGFSVVNTQLKNA